MYPKSLIYNNRTKLNINFDSVEHENDRVDYFCRNNIIEIKDVFTFEKNIKLIWHTTKYEFFNGSGYKPPFCLWTVYIELNNYLFTFIFFKLSEETKISTVLTSGPSTSCYCLLVVSSAEDPAIDEKTYISSIIFDIPKIYLSRVSVPVFWSNVLFLVTSIWVMHGM